MLLKTILNRVQWHKSFVYEGDRLVAEERATVIEVAIAPRANSRPICSGCAQKASGYDRLPARRYQFVPLWGMAVFFLYAPRRVECPRCGGACGTGALGPGEEPADDHVSVVPGDVGQTAAVATGCRCLSHQLGERVALGVPGSGVGDEASVAGWCRSHRRR